MDTMTERDPAALAWAAIRAVLEDRKNSLCRTLRNYPQPIAGCDVQFNHLAEQRDGVFRELARLEAARTASLGSLGDGGGGGQIAAIETFLTSSACIDGAAAQKIRAALKTSVTPSPPTALP
jgi:hypothetical protein